MTRIDFFQAFEKTLTQWSEKQKTERPLSPQVVSLTEEESIVLQSFVEAASSLIKWYGFLFKLAEIKKKKKVHKYYEIILIWC